MRSGMAKTATDTAAIRFRRLLRSEPGYGERGALARIGKAMKSSGMTVGKIDDGVSKIGVEMLAKATSYFKVSADYFFDPGDEKGELDPGPYRRSSGARLSVARVELESVMEVKALPEPARDILRSIDWGRTRPTHDAFVALCVAMRYVEPASDEPSMPGPAMREDASVRRRAQ